MNKNPTLFGLKRKSFASLSYDIDKREVVSAIGFDLTQVSINISEDYAFTIPIFISVNGIPLFPSKYEIINTGIVIYSSLVPPINNYVLNDNNPLHENSKTKQNTIGIKDLNLYDIAGRKRLINQNAVMGESANSHANKLIDNNILVPLDHVTTDWHWCHLVAFSMLPDEKAQKRNNLVCGTAACNGHMANIEAAVKKFIYAYKRPLGLEVTAITYADTSLALRISYRIFDKKGSRLSHTEYFDPLSILKSDSNDSFAIYDRLTKEFER